MTAVAAAFYPIFFYPYMHKREYSKCFLPFVTSNVYNRTSHNATFNVPFRDFTMQILVMLSNYSFDKVTELC